MLGSSYHNLSMQTTGLAGIEPTAYRLGGDRSIQLSYSPKQHLIVSDFVTIAGLIVIRLFARLKPKELQKCFIGWMQAVQTMTEGELLNIDGKTLRGAKEAGLGATHAEETSARLHPQILREPDSHGQCLVSFTASGTRTTKSQREIYRNHGNTSTIETVIRQGLSGEY